MSDSGEAVRILYLITDLNVGGAQKVLVHLLSRLDGSRFAPVVASLYGGDGLIAGEIRDLGVPVVDLGMAAKWRVDALWRLYRFLRRQRPAILHSSLFHANLLARILGRLARVPVVVSWRQNVSIGGKLRELVNRSTAWLDDHVVAVSDLARQAEIERAKVSPAKVTVIHNCIDASAYSVTDSRQTIKVRCALGIPLDVPLIVYVGRFHQQKGLFSLLLAMPEIERRIPDARLLLVGDGELRQQLGDQARSLGVLDAVVFAGTRGDVPEILGCANVFVLPSLWEGLPLALLEAMAAGLPVVATEVGGVPEVVVDDVTGFLVPPSEPGDLAHTITKLLADRALCQRMGQAGRERVIQHFSADQMVDRIERLYAELLRMRTRDGRVS